MTSQAAAIDFLADPAAHGGAAVERIETHAALVFLAGDRACKIKRAVRLPYLDFSTLEKRRAACEAELRLNRRTAPSLYREVTPVVRRPDGRLALGGPGQPIEWVLIMRRFDQEHLFDRMAEAGALTRPLVAALAEQVAAFHREAERAAAGAGWGGSARFRATLLETLDELRSRGESWFDPGEVEALREAALAALDRAAPLLDRRRDEGFVRRCHGDLHLRNICLLDGRPTLFDGIEFNDALGWIDIFDDLAFLMMDLDHRRLRPFANLVLNRYAVLTGDWGGLAVLPLFLAHRALVRAKVAVTTAALAPGPERLPELRAEAGNYAAAARLYLHAPEAAVIAVGGASGSGKTSLAARLAPWLGPAPGAIHLRSDVLRKRLAGVPETERLPESAYTPEQHERVFGTMFQIARKVLAAGHAVVLDGVFGQPEYRAAAAAVAEEAGTRFAGLWLEAPAAALAGRVAARRGDASDATPKVVARQIAAGFGIVEWRRLDSTGSCAQVAAAASRTLRNAGLSMQTPVAGNSRHLESIAHADCSLQHEAL